MGEAPYKDFPFEYPPAALVVLRVPLHAAALTGIRYETAFALWMAVFDGPSVNECYERKPSILPQQALALFNSVTVL